MGLFSIFSNKSNQIKEFSERGAVIVDVRSPGEFKSGHVKGSKNIPLQNVTSKAAEMKKWGKPVIFCCASGMRSAQASSLLKREGLECMNGGSWHKVKSSL